MALTEIKIKNLKAKESHYTVTDGEGLQLKVSPTGGKSWEYRYSLNGKQGRVSIGQYPVVTLAEAREKRLELQRVVFNGKDPAVIKKIEKAKKQESDIFRLFVQSWLDNVFSKTNKDILRVQQIFENHVYPTIGNKDIQQITVADILIITDAMRDKGLNAATLRVKSYLNRVFDYAVTRQKISSNPSRSVKNEHVGKIQPRDRALSRKELSELMRAIYFSSMTYSNKLALHLLMLTGVRKSNVLSAKWSEFDFDSKEWRVPKVENSRKNRGHVVYLSAQALEILQQLKQLSGSSVYILPSRQNNRKHLSEPTLNNAVKQLKLDMPHFTLHDFRHTISTILHEAGHNTDVIEKALAHEQTGTRRVYNQAEYAEQRKELLQVWANFIDSCMTDGNVILGNFRKVA